jgi:Flagellar hook-basal body protein
LLIAGKLDNLHDLTIAAEVSSVNFQALVEVKNRVIDAYKEIMRIQV